METEEKDLESILKRIPASWGKFISVGPGWHHIIINLDKELAKIDSNYEIHQVKQKFGGLRFYCSLDGNDKASALISKAEEASYKTCEECSHPGRPGVKGWIRTLCPLCSRRVGNAQ